MGTCLDLWLLVPSSILTKEKGRNSGCDISGIIPSRSSILAVVGVAISMAGIKMLLRATSLFIHQCVLSATFPVQVLNEHIAHFLSKAIKAFDFLILSSRSAVFAFLVKCNSPQSLPLLLFSDKYKDSKFSGLRLSSK